MSDSPPPWRKRARCLAAIRDDDSGLAFHANPNEISLARIPANLPMRENGTMSMMRKLNLQSVIFAVLAVIAAGAPTSLQAQVEVHGFAELDTAARLQDDPAMESDFTLQEARAQLKLEAFGDLAEAHVKLDFVRDELLGETRIEVREAYVTATLGESVELRAGRQILTWGTGDLLFLNDLFPKDYIAFFVGQDDEYLKAPSNSVKLDLFAGDTTFSLVWTPIYTSDVFPTGEVLSIGLPEGMVLEAKAPPKRLGEGEFAGRIARTAGSTELAAYGYYGRLPQPMGIDESGMPFFPRLWQAGASIRRPLFGGIFWLEGAWGATEGDPNETVPEDAGHAFAGFEREMAKDFTVGVQVQVDAPREGDSRTQLTLRLTKLARRQTVRIGFFGFYSPDDKDGHLRPSISYDLSDSVRLTAGANIMWGDATTPFGQLEKNTNAYARVRYSF